MPKLSKADKTAQISANEARRRKEVALAKKHELDLEERKGLRVPVVDVKSAWVKIAAAIKAGVMQIPERSAQRVAAAGDWKEVRKILQVECEAALRAIHDELQSSAR